LKALGTDELKRTFGEEEEEEEEEEEKERKKGKREKNTTERQAGEIRES
jgi:hypothetical protein